MDHRCTRLSLCCNPLLAPTRPTAPVETQQLWLTSSTYGHVPSALATQRRGSYLSLLRLLGCERPQRVVVTGRRCTATHTRMVMLIPAPPCGTSTRRHSFANAVRLEALGIEEVADIEHLSGGALEPSVAIEMAPLPPAGGVSPPPGLTWLVRARGGRNYSTAVYRAVVLALTFGTYALYHATRKPMSIVKGTLRDTWEPFDADDGNAVLGSIDVAFLATYAVGMFFSGHVADTMDPRIFLTIGMLGSGLFTIAFGMCYFADVHSVWIFYAIQVPTLDWILTPSVVSLHRWPHRRCVKARSRVFVVVGRTPIHHRGLTPEAFKP
jgi:hypothetical protein